MLKIAVLGTWVPARKDMAPEQRKYYKNIEVFSHSVLPKSKQNRKNPNSHESLVLFALTRPLWDVEVHCIECLDYQGRGSFADFMKALNYCRDYVMPDLIQASLGWSQLPDSQKLEMRYASKHLLGLNTVLSAAGGNEGIDPVTGNTNPDSVCYPAKLDEVIACGSSEDGKRSGFSSIGEEILFTMDGNQEQGVGLDGVMTWSGTSLASPKLAGVCARMMMEADKLPVKIAHRQEWLLSMLPFYARNPLDKINKYDMLNRTDELGFGSLEWLYKKMTTDFDRYQSDNL